MHVPFKGSLYPLLPSTSALQKIIFNVTRFSIDHWHNSLGHPAHDIVIHIIQDNNLPCDSLQKMFLLPFVIHVLHALSHQLTSLVSSSHAISPLTLIHIDVWGPTIQSFGHKKYYVTLLMAIVSLHGSICCHKYEVFRQFIDF
jgi:hypothetical protein